MRGKPFSPAEIRDFNMLMSMGVPYTHIGAKMAVLRMERKLEGISED